MDESQGNHLKAYGVAYTALSAGVESSWLLNYRGGAFLLKNLSSLHELSLERGVDTTTLSEDALQALRLELARNNMAEIKLEKSPKIAVYTPPNTSPWADAVTLALTYAEIPFDTIYDNEVLKGGLEKYDWLHLHHEDFTGQYSKFWLSYRNHPWFQEQMMTYKKEAMLSGYDNVSKHKGAVARAIQLRVFSGLFLFAMCTATETIDIALATQNIDIVPGELDGTDFDRGWNQKIDYSKTFAFENFTIFPDVMQQSFSDIDYNQVNTRNKKEVTDFVLFEFSAKIDPIPTLLNQNHKNRIAGFYGQTTGFSTEKIKDGVTVLAKSYDGSARYIYGNYGKGAFTFYGGHAPDDKNHFVGDEAPNLELYRNSAAYRLILNNVLFPSAKPPKKKT